MRIILNAKDLIPESEVIDANDLIEYYSHPIRQEIDEIIRQLKEDIAVMRSM